MTGQFTSQQFVSTLRDLTGSCLQVKPNAPEPLIKDFLNQRLRTISDRKTNWSGLYTQGVIYLPNPYSTGEVAFTQGSNVVTGTSTAWPVADLVNTVLANGVTQQGPIWVQPGSMDNITCSTVLLIDGAGTPEIVTPIQTTPTAFLANFTNTHNSNCTVTCSSLTSCQLRTSITAPIFTVTSVASTTSLTIDSTFWGSSISDNSYSITKIYVEMEPRVKRILGAQDKRDGYPIRVNVPRQQLDIWDPQRASTGQPFCLADMGPMPSGNIGMEVWPPTQTERQLIYECYLQPAPLVNPGDRPPPFINPNILLYGAYSSLLRHKVYSNGEADPWYDPSTANYYEAKFSEELEAACNADSDKVQSQLTFSNEGMYGGGGTWWQSHYVPGSGGGYY